MTKPSITGVDWNAIDGVIFDVDGTLFDHISLRRPMVAKLLWAMLTLRMSARDLKALRLFRAERERLAFEEASDVGRRQFERVAEKLGRPSNEIERIATRWLCEEPLAFVPRYAFEDAGAVMDALRRSGIRVGVFSDYPADAKLRSLGLDAEVVRDAGDLAIGRLKPHPDGFLHVAQALGVRPERCLIIGDRDDRDGAAADRGGFLFLKKVPPGAARRPGLFAHYSDLLRELQAAKGPPPDGEVEA